MIFISHCNLELGGVILINQFVIFDLPQFIFNLKENEMLDGTCFINCCFRCKFPFMNRRAVSQDTND